jgi:hypothetical protein
LENGREIAQVNEAAEDFKMVVETVAIFKYYRMKDNRLVACPPETAALPIKPPETLRRCGSTARIGQIVHDTNPD